MQLAFVRIFGALVGVGCTSTALALSLGCTGFVPDRGPGSDNWVGAGDIAVDPVTETSYVLRTAATPRMGTTPVTQRLFAVSPDDASVRAVTDLTGLADPRVLFTSSGVLVMAESEGHDHVQVFDRHTLAPIASRIEPGRYWGTRTSPSGRFVAVADNDAPHAPIHVLDATTLEVEIVPHDGDWLEAMWLRGREELLAIVFYGSDTEHPRTRLLAWNADGLVENGFASGTDGLWPAPTLDVSLADTTFDLLFSYTWIGVSPDDRYAVFPVIQETTAGSGFDRHRLIVLDLLTFERRIVDDAYGPVGFTADGASIVSYRYDEGRTWERSGAHLLVADADTLAVEVLDPPRDGAPQFFTTREGHWVLATFFASTMQADGTFTDSSTSALYDLSTGEVQVLGRPVGLGQHVSRVGHGELWIVDHAGLSRLALMSGELSAMPLSFRPEHLNILPSHDRLVMDDADDPLALRFFDPEARAVSASASLPMVP